MKLPPQLLLCWINLYAAIVQGWITTTTLPRSYRTRTARFMADSDQQGASSSSSSSPSSFVSSRISEPLEQQRQQEPPPPNGSKTKPPSTSSSISGQQQQQQQQPETSESLESTPIIPWEDDDEDDEDDDLVDDSDLVVSFPKTAASTSAKTTNANIAQPKDSSQPHMDLMWCNTDVCKDTIRERVDAQGHIVLTGPATGQVAYEWRKTHTASHSRRTPAIRKQQQPSSSSSNIATARVLLLIKPNDEELLQIAAQAVREWVDPSKNATITKQSDTDEQSPSQSHYAPIQVMLDPSVAARLEHYYQVPSDHVLLFESAATSAFPDLICTLGGDGLLMHAGMLFQGPSPPILSIAGGSLGFLTPFDTTEMIHAVRVALALTSTTNTQDHHSTEATQPEEDTYEDSVYPPNMPSYPYAPLLQSTFTTPTETGQRLAFGALGERLCLSIRMRLSCRILNSQGVCRAQYNILNEVVIDRGSSPYLAALECFCDNHHMTTVQADGIIFATPTGSTAYSMAAGGSVVHPAVPCILVTPICPHVLSFRSMIFPDHVVLQCVVPEDARSEASVAFDGKHRQPLHRGDCVTIQLSKYPVPTLNRMDHSNDWLSSLKNQFGFNSRPRQKPLSNGPYTSTEGPMTKPPIERFGAWEDDDNHDKKGTNNDDDDNSLWMDEPSW